MPEHFINRELSWLAFNERVLEEAERESLPLLERVKFLAISATNLDEFFMVRVGGLQIMKDRGLRTKDAAGYTPSQQLELIRERSDAFVRRQYALLHEKLLPALEKQNIHRLRVSDVNAAQHAHLEAHFIEQVFPLLSPVAVEEGTVHQLPALQIILLCLVSDTAADNGNSRHVMIALPPSLSRRVPVPPLGGAPAGYLNLEDLAQMFLSHYFPNEHVVQTARFRICRNSDIAVDDESALDLATEMEEILEARATSSTIRLEIEEGASKELAKVIQSLAAVTAAQTVFIPGELDLRSYFAIASLPGYDSLQVEPWPITMPAEITPGKSIFDIIREDDLLLNHPYDSFEPVLQLVEEAALDKDVVAIKQILYRTARSSRIIAALIKAAEAGKHVTVLVELKARFDEARNLERAEDLLRAGAQIIYGVRGLKSHAKICLVLRREAGRLSRYIHFGTGNYNESTAKLYTDISYLTCRPDYGADASSFFNTVTGRSRFVHFQKISMAPFGLRERLLDMIQSETERAKQGDAAEMMLKMNALEDPQMIEALYEASRAGVKVLLNIRGICCLRPGLKGVSDKIRVVSIIDRYLEHARIYWFRQGGQPQVFIASADFMTRNLSKRVELLTPVEDPLARQRLEQILRTMFNDNSQARLLNAEGIYVPAKVERGGTPFRSQQFFSKESAKRAKSRTPSPDVLIPHKPADETRR
ncbi:MAG: polyphosphate kinase 1 [Verrucomicrobia bacterium]|nr:polyphosphate kinase 1 [Verrucomicrobiota bacterium]